MTISGCTFITEDSAFQRLAAKFIPCAAVYKPCTPCASSTFSAAILAMCERDLGSYQVIPPSPDQEMSNEHDVGEIHCTWAIKLMKNVHR